MIKWLKSLFSAPEPVGAPESIANFTPSDEVLTKDIVTIDDDAWVVGVNGDQTQEQSIRLFEFAAPDAEQCLITYRAQVRADRLQGQAFLEMWCRFPGRGEFFSKGLNAPVSGTTGWVSSEVSFILKAGQRPDLIRLNIAVQGPGRVKLKDVEVLKTALKA